MSTSPTVSVIVPCLNAEETLAEAINSVLTQTVEPLEILVVDDGSKDRSVAVAASYGTKVRVLHNELGGPGAARRIGVNAARGKYIAFVDADDTLDPTKHEKQLAVLETRDARTLVHTGAMIFWSDDRCPPAERPGGEQAVGRCLQTVFERNPLCGASTMLRRSLVLELGNYDPELIGTEDFGMSLMAASCCEFVYIPDPLYRIRRHENNLSSRSCHMAYMHWLAQERFRQRRPAAFVQLPAESVRTYMVEPVVRAAKEAYWRRDFNDYGRLLKLARELAPKDSQIRRMWGKRWIPASVFRTWDRLSAGVPAVAVEAS